MEEVPCSGKTHGSNSNPWNDNGGAINLKRALHQNTSLKVKDLWKPQTRSKWRQWKISHQELESQKISICRAGNLKPPQENTHREGPDILRWGYSTAGTFTIKEAYFTTGQSPRKNKEPIWSKVWNPALWPKVSTFLWLVVHNRALTWDNL
jgi:hypothetical protein